MNIEKVDYCFDCGNLAEDCICEEETDCCGRCAVMMDVVDDILMADTVEEGLEILKEFVEIVEDVAFNTGYSQALRTEAECLLELAEELDNQEE